MLVMDFTEQLLSPHFLEAIKITKKMLKDLQQEKPAKLLPVHFQLQIVYVQILYNHKLFGCLQNCVVLFVPYIIVVLVSSRLKIANINTFSSSVIIEK